MLASNSQKWVQQNFLGEVTVLGILPWVLMWCSTHNPSQPSLAIEMLAKVVIHWLALAFLAEQCPPAHTAASFVFSSFSFCVLECVCVDMRTPPAVELPLEDRRGYYTWRWSYWQCWAASLGNQTWILCKSRHALHPWASLQGLCLVYPSQRCRDYQPSLPVWRLNDRGKLVGFRLFFFCSLENFYEEIKYTKPVRTKLWTFTVCTTGIVSSRKCPVTAGRPPLSSEGKEKTWVTDENRPDSEVVLNVKLNISLAILFHLMFSFQICKARVTIL